MEVYVIAHSSVNPIAVMSYMTGLDAGTSINEHVCGYTLDRNIEFYISFLDAELAVKRSVSPGAKAILGLTYEHGRIIDFSQLYTKASNPLSGGIFSPWQSRRIETDEASCGAFERIIERYNELQKMGSPALSLV